MLWLLFEICPAFQSDSDRSTHVIRPTCTTLANRKPSFSDRRDESHHKPARNQERTYTMPLWVIDLRYPQGIRSDQASRASGITPHSQLLWSGFQSIRPLILSPTDGPPSALYFELLSRSIGHRQNILLLYMFVSLCTR